MTDYLPDSWGHVAEQAHDVLSVEGAGGEYPESAIRSAEAGGTHSAQKLLAKKPQRADL
jgi:hypothetical protein